VLGSFKFEELKGSTLLERSRSASAVLSHRGTGPMNQIVCKVARRLRPVAPWSSTERNCAALRLPFHEILHKAGVPAGLHMVNGDGLRWVCDCVAPGRGHGFLHRVHSGGFAVAAAAAPTVSE